MSFKVNLEFGGHTYRVLNAQYSAFQPTDVSGRPSSIVRGGKITVSVESSGNSALFAKTADSFNREDGKLIFFKRDSEAILKEVIFKDTYIVEYTESFSGGGVTGSSKFDTANDENPTIETVTFSAKILEVDGNQIDNNWPVAL